METHCQTAAQSGNSEDVFIFTLFCEIHDIYSLHEMLCEFCISFYIAKV